MFSEELMNIDEPLENEENIEDYGKVVNKFLKYAIEQKKQIINKDSSLIDLIYDFCLRNGYSIYYVGDAIQSNYYLKEIIFNDCIHHKLIKTKDLTTNSTDLNNW